MRLFVAVSAFAFANLGIFFLCFAGLDETFAYLGEDYPSLINLNASKLLTFRLYAGLCCILLTVGAGPAYMQILSETIEENEIGQILANMVSSF